MRDGVGRLNMPKMVRNMWDDEGDNALFGQEGNFTDQEAFETFVEDYRPTWSFHPDEIDDLNNVFNVDFEQIGDSYLGEDRYVSQLRGAV
jgi:hypothetical protein